MFEIKIYCKSVSWLNANLVGIDIPLTWHTTCLFSSESDERKQIERIKKDVKLKKLGGFIMAIVKSNKSSKSRTQTGIAPMAFPTNPFWPVTAIHLEGRIKDIIN